MPHIILHTNRAREKPEEIKQFFRELHLLLHHTAGIKLEHCKSRLLPVTGHLIGDGQTDQNFAHLEIRLLEGRPAEIKQKLGEQVLALLKKYFSSEENRHIQLSVELIDMQKSNYHKFPPLA